MTIMTTTQSRAMTACNRPRKSRQLPNDGSNVEGSTHTVQSATWPSTARAACRGCPWLHNPQREALAASQIDRRACCCCCCLQVDVFVMVADAQGLILDSRDYLAPLVTPWEAAIALSGRWVSALASRCPQTRMAWGGGMGRVTPGEATIALSGRWDNRKAAK